MNGKMIYEELFLKSYQITIIKYNDWKNDIQ